MHLEIKHTKKHIDNLLENVHIKIKFQNVVIGNVHQKSFMTFINYNTTYHVNV